MSQPVVTELTAHRMAALLSRDQSAGRLPSVVAGVVRDGSLAWAGSHGSCTGGEAPSTDTQYRIGSITKTMTAILVLQLRDDGALDLADRLDQHLPGVGYGGATIRSLLSHSSGMQSEPAGSWWERSPGATFAELAADIDDSQAAHPVGATYHYTNLAYGLLGEVIVRHSRLTWWEQVEERILQPLEMTRTGYHPQAPSATGYSVHHFAGTLAGEPAQDTGAMAPAGQVWSTVGDLAKYAVFLAGGNEAVLSRESLDEMATPQSGTLAGAASGGYGLGLRLLLGGSGVLVGHTGSMPGFLAGFFVDRVRRTAAICLANGTSGLRAEGLPLDMLGELEELEPTVMNPWMPTEEVPAEVEEILGLWHWGNTAYAFAYDGEEIVVGQLGSEVTSHRFRPRGDGTFRGSVGYHHGETLHVCRNDDGSINHLVCATFIYTRSPYDSQAPIPGGS